MTPHDVPGHDIDPDSGLPILSEPSEPLAPVVGTPEALTRTIAALRHGTGPVAIDTERAHGFRYWPRAYLIQLRRSGSGTHLVDPTAFDDGPAGAGLDDLAQALSGTEWILHAAIQDIPCLALEGLRPTTLFDTELAGRLLGLPKVGLGHMVERYCGAHLLKEHSASDWSQRPLPEDFLTYAALDVELLDELRVKVWHDLQNAGKQEWARQEFDYLVQVAAAAPSTMSATDPNRWRRTSGIGEVTTRAGLQVVKDLWQARDSLAQELDVAPSKVLHDRVIISLARQVGACVTLTDADVRRTRGFRHGRAKAHLDVWTQAIRHAARTPATEYPPKRAPRDPHRIPPPRNWERHHPEAARRWQAVRPAVNELAESAHIDPANLIAPDAVRQVCWQPPRDLSPLGVDAFLTDLGARQWQRDLVAGRVSRVLRSVR